MKAEQEAFDRMKAQLKEERTAAEALQNDTTEGVEERISETMRKIEEVKNAITSVTDTLKALDGLVNQ